MQQRHHRFFKILILSFGLILMGQGCFGSTEQQATGPDGGVFKTEDQGESWTQKRVLIQGPKGVSIADEVITQMAFDPQDAKVVYAGTQTMGLLQSLDGGDSWRQVSIGLPTRIEHIAVDPKNKCVVYATSQNNIFKTENCTRDWERIFFDPKTDKRFTSIAVDWFNPTIVYAGTTEGDIFKSTDAGLSWLVTQKASAEIVDIVFSPSDSRHVFAGTNGDGIWKTLDGGNTWLNVKNQLSDFRNSRRVIDLAFDEQQPEKLYMASRYGLMTTTDGGETWTGLNLLSQPNEVVIIGLTVHPRNGNELQYITSNSLITSSDGGLSWTAKRLPSRRTATALLVNPEDSKMSYIGFGPAAK